jgi:hypothetical protein
MKRTAILLALVLGLATVLSAGAETSYETILRHYEPIRQALLADSMDGVNEHGAAIARELRALEGDFSAGRAGASGEALEVVRDKLGEMTASADAIAGADTLEEARDGFYALTKPMVRWRQGVATNGRPVVAYCSMYKRSWLQPQGDLEIGNPYGGMPRCGEIVSE